MIRNTKSAKTASSHETLSTLRKWGKKEELALGLFGHKYPKKDLQRAHSVFPLQLQVFFFYSEKGVNDYC